MQTKVFMPYVRFSTEVEETRNADGQIDRKNKYYAYITAPGSKDEVMKDAQEWINDLRRRGDTRGPFDASAEHYTNWHRHFAKGFEDYKKGEEMTTEGTPLRGCLAFMKSEIAQAESVKIFSLEELAACNEQAIQNMGVGARALKSKAAEILATKDSSKGAEKIIALQLEVESLKEKIDAMIANGMKEPEKRGRKPKLQEA